VLNEQSKQTRDTPFTGKTIPGKTHCVQRCILKVRFQIAYEIADILNITSEPIFDDCIVIETNNLNYV